jgi:activator of HSP90 ATPase
MGDVISQTVVLRAPAEVLFRMYLDESEHEKITGAPVKIDSTPGASFSAFEGALSGTILAIAAPHLIVQSWRSTDFKRTDPDSTLVLSFTSKEGVGQIDLVHINVPDHDFQAVTDGWEKFYWTPWREYLKRIPGTVYRI